MRGRAKLFVVTFTKLLASLSLGDTDGGCSAPGPFSAVLFVSKAQWFSAELLTGTGTASPNQGSLCSWAWQKYIYQVKISSYLETRNDNH